MTDDQPTVDVDGIGLPADDLEGAIDRATESDGETINSIKGGVAVVGDVAITGDCHNDGECIVAHVDDVGTLTPGHITSDGKTRTWVHTLRQKIEDAREPEVTIEDKVEYIKETVAGVIDVRKSDHMTCDVSISRDGAIALTVQSRDQHVTIRGVRRSKGRTVVDFDVSDGAITGE